MKNLSRQGDNHRGECKECAGRGYFEYWECFDPEAEMVSEMCWACRGTGIEAEEDDNGQG